MLKDITLGQYYPSESIIHKLDSRIKIIITLLYMVLVFLIKGFVGFALLGIFIVVLLKLSKIPAKFLLKGLKPLLFFIIFTVIINMFLTGGTRAFTFIIWDVTYEGIFTAIFMALRLIFLVAGSSFLTYTTSPIMLTDGMESLLKPFGKIGLPYHELSMMMSIALRFIPTLIEETDKIMMAQKARGADFEDGNIIQKGKALIPILVPLFISAFRRADDLATAMEARCYSGGSNRTKLKELHLGKKDFIALTIFVVFSVFVVLIGILNLEIRGF
ncbi:MAG: energy-coupling factor transporter transmembrane protein EcfT [Clostridia bacterium]|nr:energy-coupling factor transporter transmembrane protein EcfT [Clostridia bacterium]